jgi:hypothetical protein
LFHAHSTQGLRPFEALTRQESTAVFPWQLAHLPFPHRLIWRHDTTARRRWPRLLGRDPSRRPDKQPLTRPLVSSSLGVLPSRVYHLPTLPALRRRSSQVLRDAAAFYTAAGSALRSLNRSAAGDHDRSLGSDLNPSRIPAPFCSWALRRKHTGLCIHLISSTTSLPHKTDS